MRSFPLIFTKSAVVLGAVAAFQVGCKGPLDDEDPLAEGGVPPVGQPVANADGTPALEPNSIDSLFAELTPGSSGVGAGDGVLATPIPAIATVPYTIQKGDTLSHIATKHGTQVATLQQLNGLKGSFIRYGQTIKVPAPAGTAPLAPTGVPAPDGGTGDALSVPGELGTVPTPAPPTTPPVVPPTAPAPGSGSRLDNSGLGFGGASTPRPRTPPRNDNDFLNIESPN